MRWFILFTGIVEEIGIVKQILRGKNSAVLAICAKRVLEDTKIGDSISVNGICLTVTRLFSDCFYAEVMHETLNRSALSQLVIGNIVNLERAMPVNGRFGGHIVVGHVDGVGYIKHIRKDDIAVWYTIQAESPILRYIVEKGSITIDGISLTVATVGQNHFSVSIIPHTINQTNLYRRNEGDMVNLEIDIIAKYIEKLFHPIETNQRKNAITRDMLSHYGF